MKAFNLGDLVTLKSGSPVMTVEGQDKDKKILCVWFNKKGEKCNSSFFADTLKKSFEEPSITEETEELSNIEETCTEETLITEEAQSPEEVSIEEALSPEEASTEETEKSKKTRKPKKHHNDEQQEQASND